MQISSVFRNNDRCTVLIVPAYGRTARLSGPYKLDDKPELNVKAQSALCQMAFK